MRSVLDTNVLVSGMFDARRPPGQLVDRWLAGELDVVMSESQVREIRRVLGYEKIRKRLDSQRLTGFLATLEAMELVPDEALPAVHASDDPDYYLILAAAVAGAAELIVTGDHKHLLPLGAFEGIPIVTPTDAMKRAAE